MLLKKLLAAISGVSMMMSSSKSSRRDTVRYQVYDTAKSNVEDIFNHKIDAKKLRNKLNKETDGWVDPKNHDKGCRFVVRRFYGS
jgi:hypothetical protein